MIKTYHKKSTKIDVLVLIIGHQHPDFLGDTAESFDHYNQGSDTIYRLVFAVDANPDCAAVLADRFGSGSVFCSPKPNGWGRGIFRTMAQAMDHFHRTGLRWDHLLTIDSDTLVVGRCLDSYVEKVEAGVCFVGQRWGGDKPFSSANPGPVDSGQRQVRYLAKLGLFPEADWNLVNYMMAGPFCLWTRHALDFLTQIGLLPGPALNTLYPFVLFPHDQMTTLVLGIRGHESRDVGSLSLLHCGDVGGDDRWKTGLPSQRVGIYGEVPLFPDGTAVIHPIRARKFSEGKVRSFFRKVRTGDLNLREMCNLAG